MMKSKFSIVYDNTYFYTDIKLLIRELDREFDLQQDEQEPQQKMYAKIFLLDSQSISIDDIYFDIQHIIPYQITAVKVDNKNKLVAFQIPNTNIIVESTFNYLERKPVFRALNKVLPSYFIQFNNQTYSQMGFQFFKSMYELKSIMSNLNENVYDCFQTFRTAKLRVRNNKNCEQVDQEEGLLFFVDENKQYTNILLNSTYDYCKYDTLDEPQPYDGNLREGFQILKNCIVSKKYCLNISPETLICCPFVKFALDNNLIQEEDIIEMLIPRYTISSNVFQNFAALVLQAQQTNCICKNKK